MRVPSAIALAALAASGCTWGPDMSVTGVAPSTVYRDEAVIVAIRGERFGPEVVVDFDDPAGPLGCGAYSVELRAVGQETVRLREVARLSEGEVRARLPPGLGKVPWDVVVIAPGGTEAQLAGGLRVVECDPPSAPCDDGNGCTGPDACLGSSGCANTPAIPDESGCAVDCTAVGSVAGRCRGGVCVPDSGEACPAPAGTCEAG